MAIARRPIVMLSMLAQHHYSLEIWLVVSRNVKNAGRKIGFRGFHTDLWNHSGLPFYQREPREVEEENPRYNRKETVVLVRVDR